MYIINQKAFLDGAQGKRFSRSLPRFVTETIGATDGEGGGDLSPQKFGHKNSRR
jgi:hypothetical protein